MNSKNTAASMDMGAPSDNENTYTKFVGALMETFNQSNGNARVCGNPVTGEISIEPIKRTPLEMVGAHGELGPLFEALSAFRGEIVAATKTAFNDLYKSNYSTIDDVWAVVEKPLATHGLSLIQQMETSVNGHSVIIRTILAHKTGAMLVTSLCMPVLKIDPQGFGSTATFARKYTMKAMLGIAEADDDGNEGGDVVRRIRNVNNSNRPEPVSGAAVAGSAPGAPVDRSAPGAHQDSNGAGGGGEGKKAGKEKNKDVVTFLAETKEKIENCSLDKLVAFRDWILSFAKITEQQKADLLSQLDLRAKELGLQTSLGDPNAAAVIENLILNNESATC